MIELLVVFAIIAILARLLRPVLAKAKAKALSIACVNDTKQMALISELYANDHQERLVSNGPPPARACRISDRTKDRTRA